MTTSNPEGNCRYFLIEYQDFYYEDTAKSSIDAYPKVTKAKIVKDTSMLSVFRKVKKKLWGKIQFVEKINKHTNQIWLRQTNDENIAHKMVEIKEVKYKYEDTEFFDLKDFDSFEVIDQ